MYWRVIADREVNEVKTKETIIITNDKEFAEEVAKKYEGEVLPFNENDLNNLNDLEEIK